MINNLDFEQGDQLLEEALPVAENIVRIKKMFVEKNFRLFTLMTTLGNGSQVGKRFLIIVRQKVVEVKF